MKIRVLLYKAKWGDKSIVDNLISLWTRSKYAHVEIWTPDEDGKFSQLMERYVPAVDVEGNVDTTGTVQQQERKLFCYGTCWTSTLRGDSNGTVKRPALDILKNPHRWEYIEIEVTQEQYGSLVTWMEYQVKHNNGYSHWDLLKFIFPVHFPDDIRNICSEFVNNGLAAIEVYEKFGIVSPKKVYQKLIAKGYKVKSM